MRTVPISGSVTDLGHGRERHGERRRAVDMSLLQAGILPTFYQFTEATIEVKLSITMKETTSSETKGTSLGLRAGRFGALAFGSPVDYRTANTYSYTAQGSSVLRATMRPAPTAAAGWCRAPRRSTRS